MLVSRCKCEAISQLTSDAVSVGKALNVQTAALRGAHEATADSFSLIERVGESHGCESEEGDD